MPCSVASDLGLHCLLMSLKKDARLICLNPLYSGNPLTSTFANSEDPDEMQHICCISSGSNLFVKVKKNLQTEGNHI